MLTPAMLADEAVALYPRTVDFAALRAELDPECKFGNNMIDAMFPQSTRSPRFGQSTFAPCILRRRRTCFARDVAFGFARVITCRLRNPYRRRPPDE